MTVSPTAQAGGLVALDSSSRPGEVHSVGVVAAADVLAGQAVVGNYDPPDDSVTGCKPT